MSVPIRARKLCWKRASAGSSSMAKTVACAPSGSWTCVDRARRQILEHSRRVKQVRRPIVPTRGHCFRRVERKRPWSWRSHHARAPSTDRPGASSRTFEKSPSNEGSSRRMRSTRGGMRFQRAEELSAPPDIARRTCGSPLQPAALGSVEPALERSNLLDAPAMPSGLRSKLRRRGICQELRARNRSLIRFAKNTPMYPIT